MKNNRPAINDFINRSFRDIADKDYISARMAYRYGLEQQFLWAALQCLEKYLKAILLYNGKNTIKLKHSILDAYYEVLNIQDIKFDFPSDIETFIQYLDANGTNRYFEYPYSLLGDESLSLDRTVWHIRRYCYFLRAKIKNTKGESVNLFPYEIKKIQHKDFLKRPNKYIIFGGFLEKVLNKKKSELRKQLIWKNFYYGSYKKRIIKKYTKRMTSENPTHYLFPEVFSELEKIVYFSKDVKLYFKNLQISRS